MLEMYFIREAMGFPGKFKSNGCVRKSESLLIKVPSLEAHEYPSVLSNFGENC